MKQSRPAALCAMLNEKADLKLVTIAHSLRPRGNKGELAALPLTNQPDRLTTVLINDKPLQVERIWMHGDQLIFKFQGVDTISDAEKLAGADVCIPFEQRAPLADGEVYQSDLIGCEVLDATGRSFGLVTEFEETGGTPLLHIGDLLIPFAKSICIQLDLANKQIVVNLPEGLLDLN
jgi:16S rRNA processing protein RimM